MSFIGRKSELQELHAWQEKKMASFFQHINKLILYDAIAAFYYNYFDIAMLND